MFSITSNQRKLKNVSIDGKSFYNFLRLIYRGINIDKNLLLSKYQFNKTFHLIGAEEFLKDMFNDRNVVDSFGPLRGMSECTGVKFTQMNCNVLNMSFFDIF